MTSHSPKEMSDEDVIRTGLMPVAVEGIGRFIFKRRTFEREMRSTARYHELTGGVAAAGSQFDSLASALGDYETLVESHPPGWSVREVRAKDLIEHETFVDDLLKVWAALLSREAEFRPSTKRRREEAGEGAAAVPGAVVPPEIQPPAQ